MKPKHKRRLVAEVGTMLRMYRSLRECDDATEYDVSKALVKLVLDTAKGKRKPAKAYAQEDEIESVSVPVLTPGAMAQEHDSA